MVKGLTKKQTLDVFENVLSDNEHVDNDKFVQEWNRNKECGFCSFPVV